MKTSLVILAAGMGSRYGGLKQIDPIGPNGEIVIDYSIYDALRAGFEKVVFIIRPDIEKAFRAAIGHKFENRAEVHYAFQRLEDLPGGFTPPEGRTKPWGTGHALLSVEKIVREPFAILNADDFYGAGAYRTLHRFLTGLSDTSAAQYALVGFILKNTLSPNGSVSRGICRTDANGLLTSVTELLKIARDPDGVYNENPDGSRLVLTGEEYVSMNFWGFTPAIFEQTNVLFEDFLREKGGEQKSEFYIPSIADILIKQGKATIEVLSSSDTWFGITYPEDKPEVEAQLKKLIDQGAYPTPLFG